MKLEWGNPGGRFYHSGLDRGVLYVGDNAGVPWDGLVSVQETVSGGDPVAVYVDGVKVLNYSSRSESGYTLNAYWSPPEFDYCDGIAFVGPGLQAKHQVRSEFSLSYRTRIGNDITEDYGYTINLVYNLTAAPSDRNNQTVASQISPDVLSWSLSSRPQIGDSFVPTSHFVLDSTRTSEANIQYFEDILYGSETRDARIPTFEELAELKKYVFGTALYNLSTYK